MTKVCKRSYELSCARVPSAKTHLLSSGALGAATHKAAANLVSMYETQTQQRKTAEGAFDQSETSWFVSGMCWWAVFDNSAVNGDKSSDGTAGSAISEASFNQVGDLLGGSLKTLQEKFRGKWNDDIAWWALASKFASIVSYNRIAAHAFHYLFVSDGCC